MFEDESGMPQPLHQGADLDVAFPGVSGQRGHLIDADGLWGPDLRAPAVSQLVLELEDDGIDLVPSQPVDAVIVVFHGVQMVLDIDVDGPVFEGRPVRDPAGGHGLPPIVPDILQQLLQRLTAVEQTRFPAGMYGRSASPDDQPVSFRRFWECRVL